MKHDFKMKKIFMTTFCCSLLFLIYIWSWLSWYAWTTTSVIRGKELPGCADGVDRGRTVCIGCVFREEDQIRQKHPIQASFHQGGHSCLESSRMHGHVPSSRRFLTIGIPSVSRKKGKYLPKTLRSLVDNLEDGERSHLTIVVLVADPEESTRWRRANATHTLFRKEVESGLVLLIQPMLGFYPVASNSTRRTFNDSLERVQWRSRQVLDFAYLLSCASDMAEYFLILEDDVVASPGYAGHIREFISTRRGQDWVSLTFSGFFVIGRLLRDADLHRLAHFLLLFQAEKPVDLLVLQFLDLLVQDRSTITRRIPGLFQHIGLHSSLGGKIQKAKDRSFSGASTGHPGNPPADIVTTLGVYKRHLPEYCYNSYYGGGRYFWGSAPKANDTLDVVLHRPLRLKRLTVVSGHPSHKSDYVRNAVLKLSPRFVRMTTDRKAECKDFWMVDRFRDGIVDVSFGNSSSQAGQQEVIVQCIRIEFVKKQSNWVLIREIVVRGNNI